MNKRKAMLVPAVAALILGALSAAQQAHANPAQTGQPSKVTAEAGVQSALECDGGVQRAVFVRTDSTLLPITEGAFVPVPGMLVHLNVPDAFDQILVTYSAEALIDNADFAYNIPGDRILIRVMLNGAPMEPLLSDQIFNTDVGQSNAVQACKRVPEGDYDIWVEVALQDFAGNAMPLTGHLDGQALTVQQSN
jgi:hypothetical protein